MKNFTKPLLGSVVAICVVVGMASGATIYGPLTFEAGDQGGPYTTFGPDAGQVDVTFTGTPGDMVLNLDPTVNGNGLAFDTGFSTTQSSYTVSLDGQWNADNSGRFTVLGYTIPNLGGIGIYPYYKSTTGKAYIVSLFDVTNPLSNSNPEHVEDWTSGAGYKVPCFEAEDQISGDGTSDLNFGNPHSLIMNIVDTGDNATSVFSYTWEQAGNTWVASETFANIRTNAINEAVDKGYSTEVIAHVGDLFDTLVSTARDSSGSVGFGYQVFSASGYCEWNNTTVTAVPEPSTLVLLIGGSLAALALIRRKR